MKRKISSVLILAMLLLLIPAFGVSADINGSVLQDFENFNASTDVYYWNVGGECTYNKGENNGWNWALIGKNGGQSAIESYPVIENNNWTDMTGLAFYINNSSAVTIPLDIRFVASDIRYEGRSGGSVYLTDMDGITQTVYFRDYRLDLPAEFEGTVTMPFSSMGKVGSTSTAVSGLGNAQSISIASDVSCGAANIRFDSFIVFNDEGKVLTVQDFDGSASITSCVSVWSGGGLTTQAFYKQSTVFSMTVGSQAGSSSGSIILVMQNLASADWTEATGISFNVQNISSTEMILSPYIDFGSTRYVLKSSGASIKLDYANLSISATADYWLRIPAGFIGTVKIPFSSFVKQGGTASPTDRSNPTQFAFTSDISCAGASVLIDNLALYESASGGGENNPYMIQNFEAAKVAYCMSYWTSGAMVDLSLSKEYTAPDTASAKSAKITFGEVNGSQTSSATYIKLLTTDWSNTNGIKFWIKNPGTDSVDFSLYFQETSNERWITKTSNAIGYLYPDDGSKYSEISFNYRVPIPAGFSGWLEIPFDSFQLLVSTAVDGVKDMGSIIDLSMDTDNNTSQGKTMYVDEMQLYVNSLADTWAAGKDGENGSTPGEDDSGSPAAVYSGSCGDTVTWTLNTGSGLMTISGKGDMANYSYFSNLPWYDHVNSIKTVVIDSGVTSIGKNAFSRCTNLISVTIPSSVASIGERAFNGVPVSLIIYGATGSYAETYAKENGYTFIPVSNAKTGDSIILAILLLALICFVLLPLHKKTKV